MIGDYPLPSLKDTETENFQVSDTNLEARNAAERLKEAVRRGGGNAAVAKRAGISLGTLNNYIAGRDMKLSFMIALARACGVNVAWLAAGEGPMISQGSAQSLDLPTSAVFPNFRAIDAIDHQHLAECLDMAAKAFRDGGDTPTTANLVYVALAYYDVRDKPNRS